MREVVFSVGAASASVWRVPYLCRRYTLSPWGVQLGPNNPWYSSVSIQWQSVSAKVFQRLKCMNTSLLFLTYNIVFLISLKFKNIDMCLMNQRAFPYLENQGKRACLLLPLQTLLESRQKVYVFWLGSYWDLIGIFSFHFSLSLLICGWKNELGNTLLNETISCSVKLSSYAST